MFMDDDVLRIGFIFEGSTDEETIPVLVANLLQRPIYPIPVYKEAPGFDGLKRLKKKKGKAWSVFKGYVIGLLIEEKLDAIIVVVDNDREPLYKRWCILGGNLPFEGYPVRLVDASDWAALCKQAQRQDIPTGYICKSRQAGVVPVVIGVAVEMLEAWLLAQPDVVEGVLWDSPILPERRARCAAPERILNPKDEIICPHNGGSGLSRKQAQRIGQGLAPGPIEAACPSFARFANDVRILK